jgi:hypothetical protein
VLVIAPPREAAAYLQAVAAFARALSRPEVVRGCTLRERSAGAVLAGLRDVRLEEELLVAT